MLPYCQHPKEHLCCQCSLVVVSGFERGGTQLIKSLESLESVYYLFSSLFLSLSLWHCSGHVISYALWRQWCLHQFLNIFVKFFVQKIKWHQMPLNVKSWFLLLFFPLSRHNFYDYISLQSIFVSGCFATLILDTQNELEAQSRWGQPLSLQNHSLLIFCCGFHPEVTAA